MCNKAGSEMKRGTLLKMLAGGDRRSVGRSEEAAAEVLANPLLFPELVRGMASGDPVVAMRSADAAEKVTAHNPLVLAKQKKKILTLARTEQQEVRWHIAQMIPRIAWSAAERKSVANILNGYLEDTSGIVRTFAMQALSELALKDSRLRPSVTRKIEELTRTGTPAMKARGKKLLPLLKKHRT